MKVISSHLVYSNPKEYASFPSVAIDSDGALYCVFRLAPTRKSKTHIDTRSIAVLMKSEDEGETWEKVSEVKIAPYNGVQDPSLSILSDGTFIINCFGYASRKLKEHTKKAKNVRMSGPYIIESQDKGKTWGRPEHVTGIMSAKLNTAVSEPAIEGYDKVLWMASYANTGGGGDTCFLLRGYDGNWSIKSRIAHDPKGILDFQEPTLLKDYGHLLCLMRVPTLEGGAIYQTHSWDGGQAWEPPRKTGIEGLPPSLLQLRDGRILCTYGYRKPPYEIRACLSRDEGITWETDKLKVIRANGGGWDIGYPSTVQLPGGDLCTVYYWYSDEDKTRRIEGTRWQL